jgi:SAM-dependent methyltransferase
MVADLVARHCGLGSGSVVLDYGCGIGRVAKELIARHGCHVIGVDISPGMRALSVEYVDSDGFFACSPASLMLLISGGLRVDIAVSIWVLQHCLRPAEDIELLRRAINAALCLLSLTGRLDAGKGVGQRTASTSGRLSATISPFKPNKSLPVRRCRRPFRELRFGLPIEASRGSCRRARVRPVSRKLQR